MNAVLMNVRESKVIVTSLDKPIKYINNSIINRFAKAIRENELQYGIRLKSSFEEDDTCYFYRIKYKPTKNTVLLKVFKNKTGGVLANIKFGDRNPNTAEFIENIYEYVLNDDLHVDEVTPGMLASLAAIALDHLCSPSRYTEQEMEKIDCVTDLNYLDSKSLMIWKIKTVTKVHPEFVADAVTTMVMENGAAYSYYIKEHPTVRDPEPGYYFLENHVGKFQVYSPAMAPYLLNLPEGF